MSGDNYFALLYQRSSPFSSLKMQKRACPCHPEQDTLRYSQRGMKRKSVIIIVFLCSIFSMPPAFAHESDRLRPSFFEGKLSVYPVPLVGQGATMGLEVTAAAGDCEGATVQFRTPAGIALLGRSVFEDQYLTRGLPHRYFTYIQVLEEGSYALQATVYFQLPNGQRRAEHFFTYLSAGRTNSQAGDSGIWRPSASPRRPFALSPRRFSAPAVAQQAASSTANVRGYITYYDDNLREEVPIRRIAVGLLEEDANGSRQIDSTYTEDDGFYSFEGVSNMDLQGATGRNIWLRASFENDVLSITDIEDILYEFESFITYRAPDGDINTDLFLNNQDQHRGLGHIFNRVMDVYDFLEENAGWHRKRITVKWPYGANSKYKYEYYLVEGTIYDEYVQVAAGSEWNRTTMFHEYGHAIMMALYGYNFRNFPQDSFEGSHWLYTVSDPGFAMKEGWAEFFEALVDDSAYNVAAYINADMPNIESNDWWTGDIDGKGNNTQGEIVEGAVASVLWDIADTDRSHDESPGLDDDDMDGMFEELWDLMLNYKPVSILEFWDYWVENSYGQTQSLYSIYTDHGISVTPPWDVNGDGVIDVLDLTVIGSHFGQQISGPVYPNPDVNRDGQVNILDVVIWASNIVISSQ